MKFLMENNILGIHEKILTLYFLHLSFPLNSRHEIGEWERNMMCDLHHLCTSEPTFSCVKKCKQARNKMVPQINPVLGLDKRVCSQITLCLNTVISACVPQMFYCKSNTDDCASQ